MNKPSSGMHQWAPGQSSQNSQKSENASGEWADYSKLSTVFGEFWRHGAFCCDGRRLAAINLCLRERFHLEILPALRGRQAAAAERRTASARIAEELST
jgi:hypothetical protein